MEKKRSCWHCRKPISNSERTYNFICPHCKSNFADKPKNEALLHVYQAEFLLSRDEEVFSKMMVMIKDIAYNQICAKLKQSGKFLLEEDLEDKISWTVWKMISLYSQPDFKITSSFIDYIGQVVLYPLYNYKLQDKEQYEISLYTPINNSSNNKKENTLYDVMKETTILESAGEVENFFYKEIEKENLISTVNDFIDAMVTTVYKRKGFAYALKMITLIDYFFQEKNNKLFTNWWDVEGLEFKKAFDNIVLLFRDSIRESSCT